MHVHPSTLWRSTVKNFSSYCINAAVHEEEGSKKNLKKYSKFLAKIMINNVPEMLSNFYDAFKFQMVSLP